MFACAMYPAYKEMLDNIKEETYDNVKRLRNHPSIALWNGNNEVWTGWLHWGWKNQSTEENKKILEGWYHDIFDTTIPAILRQIDPDRYYWPTSPSVFDTIRYGDIHYYGVWGGEDIEKYNDNIGRFNSEYGM